MSREKWRSPNTGSTYQSGQYWYARMATGGLTKSGNPAYKKIRCKNSTEATEALKRMTIEKDAGSLAKREKRKLGPYLDVWLKDTVKLGKSYKTYRTYEQHIRLYIKPRLGNVNLSDLEPGQIQAWINWLRTEGKQGPDNSRLPLSPKTVKDARGTLSSAMKQALQWKYIRSNPLEGVSPITAGDSTAVYLTSEEAKALLKASKSHPLGPLIDLGLHTGLRVGEATGLTWSHVDLVAGTIRVLQQLQRQDGDFVLKGVKSRAGKRSLSLSPSTVEVLKEQARRQQALRTASKDPSGFNRLGLVFTTRTGKPIDGPEVDDQLKGLCAKAGVPPVSFHKLRHTAATHMVAGGVPTSVVKDQLGHSKASTVDIYTHPVPAALKQAADHLSSVFASERSTGSEPA